MRAPNKFIQFVIFNVEEMSNLCSFVKCLVLMLPRYWTPTAIDMLKYRILHGIRTQKLLIISLSNASYRASYMTTATFRALYCSTWEIIIILLLATKSMNETPPSIKSNAQTWSIALWWTQYDMHVISDNPWLCFPVYLHYHEHTNV